MITCHLTKLETAADQVRKAYPKLKPADVVLIACAMTKAGRHALAVYDEAEFEWPKDNDRLFAKLVPALTLVQEQLEAGTTKKAAKTTGDEEPEIFTVAIKPNVAAGEALLEGREELKTLLSDILSAPHEFQYLPADIGWQWALSSAGWSTLMDGKELNRRIKVKVGFLAPSEGTELGVPGAKKRTVRAPKAAAAPAPEAEAEAAAAE